MTVAELRAFLEDKPDDWKVLYELYDTCELVDAKVSSEAITEAFLTTGDHWRYDWDAPGQAPKPSNAVVVS